MGKMGRRPILRTFVSQATGDKGHRDKHTRHHHTMSPEKEGNINPSRRYVLWRSKQPGAMVESTYSSNQGRMEERKKMSRTSMTSVTTPVSSVTRDSSSTLLGTGANIISVEMSHA